MEQKAAVFVNGKRASEPMPRSLAEAKAIELRINLAESLGPQDAVTVIDVLNG